MNKNEKTPELLKPFMIDYDSLKVGDEVFSSRCGYCIIAAKIDGVKYCIHIDVGCDRHSYDKNGFYYESDYLPILFKSNPYESIKKDGFPKQMLVSSSGNKWFKRTVICIEPNFGQAISYSNSESASDINKDFIPIAWPLHKEIPEVLSLSMQEALEQLSKLHPNKEIVIQ